MKKVLLIIGISIIAVIFGFFIGRIFFNKTEINETIIAQNVVNQINVNNVEESKKEEIPTSSKEEKVSINTNIVEETYYNKCNHKIQNTLKNTKKYVNMTKNELKKEFPNWEIKEFNKDEVILYKEDEDFCNEHFLVKDEDGYVTIYTINNEEEILELLDKTKIATAYLAKVDQDNLKKGMIIYTKQNLNKLIEDFE